jgi:hypothetical protein
MKFRFQWITCLAVAVLNASSIFAAPSDKSVEASKVSQVIQVYDAVIRYPAPSWFKDGNGLDQSEFFRKQNGPQFIFEQIPKGDKFESWKQLYAIRGDYIKLDKEIPLDAYISMSLKPFIDVCGKERMSFERLAGSQASGTFIMTCEDSPKAPSGSGYGKGIGEIALFHFAKVNNTFLKVYHEWRGKSFSGREPSSWPVKPEELKMMIQRFKGISVSANKQ